MSPASHALDQYRVKRDFQRTAEPAGASVDEASGNSYCVQQHAATRLHYDFRLELGGVLKSWAVPKGPSLVPGQKRLAVQTEDHPLEYGSFEGVIPEGEYGGGGTVMLWDRGTWSPVGDAQAGLAKGKLELELHGSKLRGKFVLVKFGSDGPEWLLIKRSDEHAQKRGSVEVVETATRSVASDRELDEIAADAGATPTEYKTAKRVTQATAALRDDKAATAVAREHAAWANDLAPVGARPAGVTLTHPNKVLVADAGLTKVALARYYEAIAPLMLPHLRGRPLMLLRCPNGSDAPCFYQKHAGHALPDGVIAFDLREDDGTRATYLAVESVMGLVGTVQMGALEMHVWGSRRAAVEKPDRLVIDLDPDPAVGFFALVSAATEIRDRLADAELECFVMSTGGKGLHVVAPLDPVHPFDVVKQWARRFAEQLVRAAPTRYIATASKERRRGKIFLDYLRNGRGASAVCPYSTRARPGAPVAVPLSWEELVDMHAPPRLGAGEVLERVGSIDDPWAAYPTIKQRL